MQFLNAILANASAINNSGNAAKDQSPLKISEKTGTSFKRAKQLILPASILSKNFKPEASSRNEKDAKITSSITVDSKKVRNMMDKNGLTNFSKNAP